MRAKNQERMSSYFYKLWCFSSLFLHLLVPSLALTIDGTLLLSFKYSILNDPLSVLDNWNYDDETPCLWSGVTCAQVEKPFGGTLDSFRVIGLVLPNSKLFGSIPEDFGFIQHLRILDLSSNFLNGTLPNSLFNASELQVLSLSSNALTGGLPEFSEGLKNVKLLNLSDNALSGNLPQNLPSLQDLTVVSLKRNFFSGTIPNGFQYVEVLDLSLNFLNGSLPLEFDGQRLRYLNLSSNKLSGPVSPEFSKKIPENVTLDLSFNNLIGELPESMAFSNQKTDSFRGNIDLCGKPLKKLCTIPSSLSTPPPNVSTTNSSAPAIAAIPQTIDSTPLPNSPGTTTNGAQSQAQHGLKPGTIAGIAIGDLAGIGVLAIVCLYVYQLKNNRADEASKQIPLPAEDKNPKNNHTKDTELSIAKETTSRSLPSWSCLTIRNGEETSEATVSECDDENKNYDIENQVDQSEKEQNNKYKNERSLVMVDGETELELETLLKASAYVLGSRAAASIVYKAVLEDGTAFAVRRIGESGVERFKDFENQVKAIAKLRHPNLVLLRGFYWGDNEKLVIYDYISNGSLANACYRKIGSSPYVLPFQVRLKVAKGVARGLAYIHEKKYVHGNIKPSNILLTQEMEPKISDFGLHWLIHGKNSYKTDASSSRHFGSNRITTTTSSRDGLHDQSINGSPNIGSSGFMGCITPYHSPESLKNLKPNSKWDVYSFGILLLELLSGKVFSDRELSEWTAGLVMEDKDRVLRMADVAIRCDVANREDAMLECFKLGFNCASLIPQKRPSMKDALQVLEKIQ
ncbi:hypothetical protein ACH5RR_022220 [Cinchona calisaya]|uniref:Protein kinase domain-containing protein n=1 Tax=Cinchona calisaya TaxID=153742 RepID=A0ABD2Z884_9GENT